MAYYITIKENKGYKLLDITSMQAFRRLSKFKSSSYSLEEIDLFTSKYPNELVLKRDLYSFGIITLEDITKDISIRMKNKDNLEKVRYGLVYNSTSKYLNEYYLRIKLLELQNDKVFLNKLLDYYRNSYKQESLRQINAILQGYNGNSINIYNALDMFYKDTVYDINYKTGETKIKYKSLHDLAMFIYNYNQTKELTKEEIETYKEHRQIELSTLQESLSPKKEKVDLKVKTRTKKKYDLDGQSSFF